MPVDLAAAQEFVLANARLLDRHRLAVLLGGASSDPVFTALVAYRNRDGGFGHALEPDVRGPESEPASTLHALEVLAEVGRLADPMTGSAIEWLSTVAEPDGGMRRSSCRLRPAIRGRPGCSRRRVARTSPSLSPPCSRPPVRPTRGWPAPSTGVGIGWPVRRSSPGTG
jgi:hypothetical protein